MPIDWDDRDLNARKAWYSGVADFGESVELIETRLRDRVCNAEIWVECLGQDIARLTRRDSRELTELMHSVEGWEKHPKAMRISNYGVQKGYRRILDSSELPPF